MVRLRDCLPHLATSAPSLVPKHLPCDPSTLDLCCNDVPLCDVDNRIGQLSAALVGDKHDASVALTASLDSDPDFDAIIATVQRSTLPPMQDTKLAGALAQDMWRTQNTVRRQTPDLLQNDVDTNGYSSVYVMLNAQPTIRFLSGVRLIASTMLQITYKLLLS